MSAGGADAQKTKEMQKKLQGTLKSKSQATGLVSTAATSGARGAAKGDPVQPAPMQHSGSSSKAVNPSSKAAFSEAL